MKGIIYYLADPRSKTDIRYIGITVKTTKERLYAHLYESKKSKKKTYKTKWVNKLLRADLVPICDVLEEIEFTDIKDAFEIEKQYIKVYKEHGYKLVNTTNGGEGVVGYAFTEEDNEANRKRNKEFWEDKTKEERKKVTEHLTSFLKGNTFRKGKKDPPERILSKKLEKKGKKHFRWSGFLVKMDANFKELQRWESLTDAAEELGIERRYLWACATLKTKKGEKKKCFGFYYKYDKNEKE